MQAHPNGRNSNRNFHGQKKQLLNQQAGNPPPSWRQQQKVNAKGGNAKKSKILLSELPMDVLREEVVALFHKTVGPVKDDETIMLYNNQGKARGMAIVTFQREADAYVARAKYNGKLIDSRKPIKIEIVKDEDAPKQPPPLPVAPPSLLQRLGGTTTKVAAAAAPPQNKKQPHAAAKTGRAAAAAPTQPQNQPRVSVGRRLRQKKGPRRVKKAPVTIEQLDADMAAYRAKSEDAAMS
ncbi:hypothetical protein BDY19DRAFT_769745 [Irpex rosettiformis]|uniref:Uncharacterized protein n=1 Tax=Irpex rosettiformis TaxID=378272 RepID=A0ACB8U7R4_9APHY|nr:hypothetical protein BDY19DRAFT_769745 [Irpex rosettiformis]